MTVQLKIERIVIHCSATPETMDIGIKEIDRWHRERGFSEIGYHYVVCRDGQIQNGRPIDQVPAAHKGYNTNSLAICLVGGVDHDGNSEDNFTPAQHDNWPRFVFFALEAGVVPGLHLDDDIVVPIARGFDVEKDLLGHHDLPNVNKDCPCFDVQQVWHAWVEQQVHTGLEDEN